MHKGGQGPSGANARRRSQPGNFKQGWRRKLFLTNKVMIDGKQRQFQAVGDAELVENVSEVMFDGLLCNLKLLSDVLVGVAVNDGCDDIKFPRREVIGAFPRSLLRDRREVAN